MRKVRRIAHLLQVFLKMEDRTGKELDALLQAGGFPP